MNVPSDVEGFEVSMLDEPARLVRLVNCLIMVCTNVPQHLPSSSRLTRLRCPQYLGNISFLGLVTQILMPLIAGSYFSLQSS